MAKTQRKPGDLPPHARTPVFTGGRWELPLFIQYRRGTSIAVSSCTRESSELLLPRLCISFHIVISLKKHSDAELRVQI